MSLPLHPPIHQHQPYHPLTTIPPHSTPHPPLHPFPPLHAPTLPAHPPTHLPAVYHVTEKGWTKVRGEDVGELHYKYYPQPEEHPCNSVDPLGC